MHADGTWCIHAIATEAKRAFRIKPRTELENLQTPKVQSTPSCKNTIYSLVDFFHLGRFVSGTLNFLKWWKIIVITQSFVVVIDAQAELNHSMDAACKLCGLVQVEARREQRSVEQQPD